MVFTVSLDDIWDSFNVIDIFYFPHMALLIFFNLNSKYPNSVDFQLKAQQGQNFLAVTKLEVSTPSELT